MSQLKVDTIRHTGATSDAITLVNDGTATAKITNYPHRNLIINGAMQVHQRGTASTSNGMNTMDRWATSCNGNDEVPEQHEHGLSSSDTGPWEKGFRKSWYIRNGNQTSGAGADDRVTIQYKFEAQDIAKSGWDYTSASSYVTLQFWVMSSIAQNFYGHFTSVDGTAQSYIFETGSLTANQWTKVTKTIPGNSNITVDNDTGEGFYIEFVMFRGTNKTASGKALNTWAAFDSAARVPDMTTTWYTTDNATFELTGVQLEVGDTATDFDHLSYGDELARCQRYYQKFTGISYRLYTSNVHRWGVPLPVTMRAAPSATKSYGSTTNYGTDNTGSADGTMLNYDVQYTGGGTGVVDNGSGTITLAAEL